MSALPLMRLCAKAGCEKANMPERLARPVITITLVTPFFNDFITISPSIKATLHSHELGVRRDMHQQTCHSALCGSNRLLGARGCEPAKPLGSHNSPPRRWRSHSICRNSPTQLVRGSAVEK